MQENESRDALGGSAPPQENALPEEYDELLKENAQLKRDFLKSQSAGTIYTHIALSLARGYTDLFYVNMETDEFIEFHTDDEFGVLTEARRGDDFFEGCERDAKLYVHADDQKAFVGAMSRAFLTDALGKSNIFEMVYRRIIDGEPLYVKMRVSRIEDDDRLIVIAVANVDEQVKQRQAEERMIEERIIYARLHALTGNFICVYVVDPETGTYREFNATDDYKESFAQAEEGEDFFDTVREAAMIFNHPNDMGLFLAAFTKENVMEEIEQNGIFTLSYRLLSGGKPIYVQMKAAMVEEREGRRLVVGINDIDAQVRREKEAERQLAQAQSQVNIDALTGIKNKHAYSEAEARLNQQIEERSQKPFAVVILDVNDLKKINDSAGHQAGDQHLRNACKIICNTFKHSPVFRIGGDEFAVISQGDDYANIDDLIAQVSAHNAEANRDNGIVIACGMSRFYDDPSVAAVFERADHNMYENKNALKATHEELFEEPSAEEEQQADEIPDETAEEPPLADAGLHVESDEEEAMRRYVLENFETALREKWIQVYLQPIIRSVNERVCDVEALARWADLEKGILAPICFIPALEDEGLIYKLDLYMVDAVLELIKRQRAHDFFVIPHSINLSRTDFDACDIVEEIRQRVDAAGIERDRITIEITESIIGSDFEFMKEQIERFQELGFPVWMDDFGSGYSSLDILQSIKFDLLKFDMSFMRKLEESEDGKIVLTELMRMATSLGVGTVCEGVETESQVRFLQEIGCSKLQGFYFGRPVPFDTILRLRDNKTLIVNENPEESEYFESMGRVNLYDLGVIAQGDENSIQNTFNTLPMGIIEVRGDTTRFVRSNQSYRDFIKRFFGFELSRLGTGFVPYDAAFMRNVVEVCCVQGLRSFYDEKMPDGSIVHSFARLIGANPVTGDMAVAVAVLSISEPDDKTSYAEIARALAADYHNIFVVDMDTDSYIEYSSLSGGEDLALERHGSGFFESARNEALERIYDDDRAMFFDVFWKENVIRELDERGVFTVTYRLIDTGTPIYVNMKITRMQDGNRIILGISNVDAQMKHQEEEERLRQEKVALSRIAALSTNYLVLYTVDPKTGHYIQYNPSNEFEKIGLAKQGDDFFTDVVIDAPKAIHHEDMERHLRVMTKENMMREIQETGYFVHNYRLLIGDETIPAHLKATMVDEGDGEKIILGVSIEG